MYNNLLRNEFCVKKVKNILINDDKIIQDRNTIYSISDTVDFYIYEILDHIDKSL